METTYVSYRQENFDCLVNEMLFIKKLAAGNLNTQSDSIND